MTEAAGPDPASTTVGFAGVGAIGLPMASRLHHAGWRVRAVDRSPRQAERCRDRGMQAGTDPAVLEGCEVVIAMVATGGQLLDLIAGKPFTSGALRGGTLIVMSTVGPEAAHQVEQTAGELGIAVVDCPVTGGVTGAEQGTLSLFASGAARRLDRVRPILEPMGTVRPCGDRVGDGQSLKLINQMLASIHLVAAAEAIGFARHLGLDLETVLALLPTGAAASWMLSDRGPRLAQSSSERTMYTPLDIFVKDSGLVRDATIAAGYDAPLSAAARAQWLRASAMGMGHGDDTGVIGTYLDPTGPA